MLNIEWSESVKENESESMTAEKISAAIKKINNTSRHANPIKLGRIMKKVLLTFC